MFSETELERYFNSLCDGEGLPIAGREFVRNVRSTAPGRLARGGNGSVPTRYANAKMGWTIQSESEVEFALVNKSEFDDDTFEIWDQISNVILKYKSPLGHNVTATTTSDYLLLQSASAVIVECKFESELVELSQSSPNRYQRNASGHWRCPPGEFAEPLGLAYELWSSANIDETEQRWLNYLRRYLWLDLKDLDPNKVVKVRACVEQTPGPTLSELYERVKGYTLGIPLSAILQGFDVDTFEPRPRAEPILPTRPVLRTRSRLLELLTDALRSGPAVSPTELAHSLGYSSGKYLKMRAPEICKKIEKKFRAAKGRATRCCSDDLEGNLKANLRKQQPEAIAVIAQSCGVDSDYLRKNWPDLCKKTQQKRGQDESNRAIRALKQAMRTVPPTPLSTVVRSLGWKSTARFWTVAPEMVTQFYKVNEEYRKKVIQQWRSQLEACATECPPPSITKIGQRMGARASTLRYHFPKLMKLISKRRIQHEGDLRIRRTQEFLSKVAQIAEQLQTEGLDPTAYRVASKLGKSYAWRTKEVKQALKQIEPGKRIHAALPSPARKAA